MSARTMQGWPPGMVRAISRHPGVLRKLRLLRTLMPLAVTWLCDHWDDPEGELLLEQLYQYDVYDFIAKVEAGDTPLTQAIEIERENFMERVRVAVEKGGTGRGR